MNHTYQIHRSTCPILYGPHRATKTALTRQVINMGAFWSTWLWVKSSVFSTHA